MSSPLHHRSRPASLAARAVRTRRHVRSPGFGRGRAWVTQDGAVAQRQSGISDDLRLFGATFAAGFLFVSIIIG